MEEITINESMIDLPIGKANKVAVFTYSGDGNPISALDDAVREYVGTNSDYQQFVDFNMDNPWVRVVIFNINRTHYRNG